MKIVIGSDHGGYELKGQLSEYLRGLNLGYDITDFGCDSPDSVDYPDYAFRVATAVARSEFDYGILICGTGIGVSMCANKVYGVRCALCSEPVSARLTRMHNNANILALGARIIGIEPAKEIVRTFLSTDFEGGRHARRIDKLDSFRN